MIKNNRPIIWLTGMSGSGKSTLAMTIKYLFLENKYSVRIVDGDDIREKDSKKLGFGHKDVMENNLRIAHMCQKLRKDFDVIIVPVISPYDDIRKKVRAVLEPNFHLIYLNADIESLKYRDTKGLYSASDKGLINDLIGYSNINPYDEPNNAELTIETGNHKSIQELDRQLSNYIVREIFT